MVRPAAASAPRWAAASMPRARPLTTVKPARARPPANRSACRRPYCVAWRVPTIATAMLSCGSSCPRMNNTPGGVCVSASSRGYEASASVRTVIPCWSHTASVSSTGICLAAVMASLSLRPMPGTWQSSSGDAANTAAGVPNASKSAIRRRGPTPGTRANRTRSRSSGSSAAIDVPRCLCELDRQRHAAKR